MVPALGALELSGLESKGPVFVGLKSTGPEFKGLEPTVQAFEASE